MPNDRTFSLGRVSSWQRLPLLIAPLLLLWAGPGSAQVGIAVTLPGVELQADVAPPALPVYEQPPVPAPDYLWTPGYWRWGPQGYFWVPGTWVEPPSVGLLWTPGYWGWNSGVYVFHGGYWGPHVGFYGGINYGFGYVGTGFAGGRWVNNRFAYNTAVTNVNVTVIHNTFNQTVVNPPAAGRVSFNGPNGLHAVPNAGEVAAQHEAHVPPTSTQVQHIQQASQNHGLLATVNQGRPPIAATPRPGAFHAPGAVAAGVPTRGAGSPISESRPTALQARPAASSSGTTPSGARPYGPTGLQARPTTLPSGSNGLQARPAGTTSLQARPVSGNTATTARTHIAPINPPKSTGPSKPQPKAPARPVHEQKRD